MIILICGGRDFTDYSKLQAVMPKVPKKPTLIIQGGARGADALGKQWALLNGVHCAEIPALWDYFGKSAGYKRNAAMLLLRPNYCVALPGGRGTEDMVAQCRDAGVPVWRPCQ